MAGRNKANDRGARTALATLAALVLAALLAACGSEAGGGGGESEATTVAKTCDQIDLSKPPAQPVKIRLGHGQAAEEPLWLLKVKPELAKHQGEWYEIEWMPFDSTETRLVAYQAGELDAVTIAPQVFVTGTARGSLNLAALATIMHEAGEKAFGTTFISKEGSGIDSIEDLKGKRIGIIGLQTDPDYLVRAALDKAGYDPRTDAKVIVLPFPAQADALRGGQIDVATTAEPFYTLAQSKGGVGDVFTAREVTGFSFDLLTLAMDKQFIQDNTGVACALRDDFAMSMDFYRANKDEARRALAGTEFVKIPLPVYLKTQDYFRPEGGAFDPQGFEKLIDQSIELGIFRESDRIEVRKLFVPGVTAGQ